MTKSIPKVTKVSGSGIPIRGNDIDTDRIIPARFMKVVTFDGIGRYAFYDERYGEDGKPRPHPFNDEKYQGASILLVNKNFGCGSSREHAPQALARSGISGIIGESFAEIFAGNCTAMGVPAVRLSASQVTELMDRVEADPTVQIEVDVRAGTVTCEDRSWEFDLSPAYRNSLLSGAWDSTSVLLEGIDDIRETAARLPYVSGFSA